MGELMAGKVALVSGSTRGIGRSIAEHLAAQGARVVVTGRTVAKGEKVVSRIREAGGTAEFLRLDVTDEDSVRSVIEETVRRFGGLTTLVNNAAPTEVVATTVVVLITSVVFAAYLWAADFVIQRGYVGIVRMFNR